MRRILFVDDENGILDGIRRMLHADRTRWVMDFANSGDAALQACEKSSFDVVISDMRMPNMDGATLLTHIRDRYPNTVRIVLSGNSEMESVMRAVPVAHRFLSKPCDASELRATIERVCILQELLDNDSLRRLVGAIGRLPSLSATYTSLTQALRTANTPTSKVADLIEQDIAMSAKVLQLVNSSFFGLQKTVSSVPNAVTYLGMETIKNLVLVAETFRVFVPHASISKSFCETIQQHARRTACIVTKLPVGRTTRDLVFVAALLHDIGRLVLASRVPDQFCAVRALAEDKGCEIFEAEEILLGTSHAEIGAYLLGLWGIPHSAVEAIAHHHRPLRISHSGFDCSVAIYVANLLANEQCVPPGTSPQLKDADRLCLQELGVLDRLPELRALAAAD